MSMKEKGIDNETQRKRTQQQAMCTKDTSNNEVAEISRKGQRHEYSVSKNFIKLFTWAYKKARQNR